MSSTVTLVPVMVGFPIITSGSELIRSRRTFPNLLSPAGSPNIQRLLLDPTPVPPKQASSHLVRPPLYREPVSSRIMGGEFDPDDTVPWT